MSRWPAAMAHMQKRSIQATVPASDTPHSGSVHHSSSAFRHFDIFKLRFHDMKI
jgi:hypothetical protein